MADQNFPAYLNFILTALTLGVIVVYTAITYRLHQTSQKQLAELITQRRLSIIPTLLPQLSILGAKHTLNLVNIGNGVATNIRFDKVQYASKELENTFYEFYEIPKLQPGQSVNVGFKSYLLGHLEDPKDGLVHLGKFANSDTLVRFTFKDLAGETYEEIFQMGKNGYKFMSLKLLDTHPH